MYLEGTRSSDRGGPRRVLTGSFPRRAEPMAPGVWQIEEPVAGTGLVQVRQQHIGKPGPRHVARGVTVPLASMQMPRSLILLPPVEKVTERRANRWRSADGVSAQDGHSLVRLSPAKDQHEPDQPGKQSSEGSGAANDKP